MSSHRVVSADSHINEPPDLWRDRVPAQYRDRVPRIERFEQGDAWVMEGALDPINFGTNCCAGLPAEQRSPLDHLGRGARRGLRPGGPDRRAGPDGVDAEILYPTPRIGNQVVWHVSDPDFHLACIRAYNDWLSEYASHEPERLWGVALMPEHRHRRRDRRAAPGARAARHSRASCSGSTRTAASSSPATTTRSGRRCRRPACRSRSTSRSRPRRRATAAA